MEGEFKYKLRGELKDMQNGIVEVKGLIYILMKINPKRYVKWDVYSVEVSRIDIW